MKTTQSSETLKSPSGEHNQLSATTEHKKTNETVPLGTATLEVYQDRYLRLSENWRMQQVARSEN